MSNPKKHHYLPEFYLRRWCGSDGRLFDFRRFEGKLAQRQRFPSETGFERELYSIRSRQDAAKRQVIEAVVMSKLDAAASQALDFMERQGEPPDDPRHRVGWTRFLLSLIHRSPHGIARMRAKIDAHSEEVLRDVAARYEVLRGPTDPLSFEEYLQSDDGAIAQESMAVLLQNVLNSKLLSRTLSAMIWGWVRIHRSKFGLLTSDIPIMLSNGLGHPDAFVLLPVGPDAIFMASPRREIIQAFTSQKGADLERALNDAVVRQGRNVIIARDARQRRFIDSRFLKGSEPEGDWAVQTWEHPLIDLTKGISAMDPPLGPEIKRQIRLIRNTR